MLETAKWESKLEGKEEGALNKVKVVAKRLIQRGFDNADIADITGLNLEMIEQIRMETS
ncbi:MAG TPA: hypothetical protein PKD90_11935 [Phnomibacter sp.]|nr:hypothetical protein [Phnomibacter sp.]